MSNRKKFDVFLSHNSLDKQLARQLKARLAKLGVKAWLDEDELTPGRPWQPLIAKALTEARSVAVLIGPSGVGPWEDEEMQAALNVAVKDKRAVFAVLLPRYCKDTPIPMWLQNRGFISMDPKITREALLKFSRAATGKNGKALASSKRKPKTLPPVESTEKTSKNYELAEHVVRTILGKEPSLYRSDIFANNVAVTQYAKAMINSTPALQTQAISAIKVAYSSVTISEKAQLAYLLGRLSGDHVHDDAVALLVDYLKQNVDQQNQRDQSALILERTIYISLIYLGEASYADQYCEKLLMDPERDEVNRGFHLAYYEDMPPSSFRDTGLYDDLRCLPKTTLEVLFSRLNDDLRMGMDRPMNKIEAQTVISICVNRHLSGLLDNASRVSMLTLINDMMLSNKDAFLGILEPYIRFGKHILAQQTCSIASEVGELLRLKEVERSGWNAGGRRCVNPESAADHSWGSMLIAELFLPEDLAGEPEYSKNTILRMLLIHDLSEVAVGDIPSSEQNYETLLESYEFISTRSFIASLSAINGPMDWRKLWVNFCDRKGINAQIASDIEAIESYLQMRRYLSKPECSIADADVWTQEVGDKLHSPLGKMIFASLRAGPSALGLKV